MPNLFTRIINRILRRQESTFGPAGMVTPWGYGGSQHRAWKYDTYARDGYRRNPIVYACIREIIGGCASINLVFEDADGEEIPNADVKDEKLVDLMQRPNPNQSIKEFVKTFVLHLSVGGIAYIHGVGIGREKVTENFDRTKSGELWLIQPDNIEIQTKDREVVKYKLTKTENETLEPDEVVFVKYPDPLDEFRGMSPMEAAAYVIDTHNASLEYNKSILEKGGVPSGIVFIKGTGRLPKDERERIEHEFTTKYGPAREAGKIWVMYGEDFDYKQIGAMARDMDWLNGEQTLMRRICAVFGVPSVLLDDPSARTYSNYREARRSFYQETILPIMEHLVEELNHWLMPKFETDLRLGLKYDHIDALSDDINDRFTRLKGADWMTLDDKRREVGLEEKGGIADQLLIPLNLIPIDGEEMTLE